MLVKILSFFMIIYYFNIDGFPKAKYEILTKIINKERIDIIIVLQNTERILFVKKLFIEPITQIIFVNKNNK